MKKENLHQPFEISVKELEESPLKEHEHTFLNWFISFPEQVYNASIIINLIIMRDICF